MKKILVPIGLALTVLVLAGGIFVLLDSGDSNNSEKTTTSDQQVNTTTEPQGSNEPFTVPQYKAGYYEPYSKEKLQRAKDGQVVLFFRASWCPTCKKLDQDINLRLEQIPQGVSILSVDYDKETALKKQYGVTYQHTLVQVDESGKQIKKWNGSETLAKLTAEIQK